MEHPGLLYVWATLLPLASFVLLLLAGALRWTARPYAATPLGGALYRLTGGETQGRTGAYVATGAIGLAFVLCLIGFILHAQDVSHHAHATPAAHGHEGGHEHAHGHDAHAEDRWAGQWEFARLRFWDDREGEPTRPATTLAIGYRIDTLAATMFLMVTFIATLIHIFSIGYMADELQPTVEDHHVHTEHGHLHRRGRFGRFFLFLSLFCFSMLNLVLADNLFQVFVSWELVGICSYLLIGFYYERQSASNAANKAFITNRVGDAGFIIGLLILWTYVGTFNFQEIFSQVRSPLRDSHGEVLDRGGEIVRADWDTSKQRKVLRVTERDTGSEVVLFPTYPVMDDSPGHFHGVDTGDAVPLNTPKLSFEQRYNSMPYWLLVAAGLGIFLGCVGKSAQFPLHVWLPDAMEGPTPVSALIHAATMVAAGVYLVGRCFPLFTPEALLVIAYTGGITLFVAATIALVATDIKKVLAYSTVSQLGYMMLALGVGGWAAGLFHLVTHAFFKALLFLGSGSVIYGCHHEQDMLKMGGLYPKMRTTALTMLVGVLAIAGTPFLSGWYSKDAILAQAIGFVRVHPHHLLLFLLPLITAGLTTFYMFRMWLLTFTGEPKDAHVYEHAHESPAVMTVPLVILAFFSVVVGWGWPIWDVHASALEGHLHHAQHPAVAADFGVLPHGHELDLWGEAGVARAAMVKERHFAHEYGHLAGNLALGIVLIGVVFAFLIYYFRKLDPEDAREQFPGVYRFLVNKWYFDELYSAILVRPALVVATWCRAFDLGVIDGVLHGTARGTVRLSDWDRFFDARIVDGLVNLVGNVIYGIGSWLRTIQTGYIRSYVLFLVLAVVGIYLVLSYFVTLATAG